MQPARKSPVFTYADFDIQALCQLCNNLRQNVACTCDINQVPASGGFHWAIFVTFEDGIEWVLRSPHTGYGSMPMEINSKLLESEAATLKYVSKNSDIPVPDVYSYCSTVNNDIGIPYILMSKATGFPLQKAWKSFESSEPRLSPDIESKILTELGAITYQLSKLRFDRIGSLFEPNKGVFRIGECLSRGHILHERHSLEDLSRGPFTSEAQFFDSLVDAFLQHAEMLPLSHHCFTAPVPCRESYKFDEQYRAACDLWNNFVTIGCKVDSSINRLDYVIVGEALREMLSDWLQALPKQEPHSVPLCHPDLSVNNIYVDNDFNITCIIDWTFCSSVPDAMLMIPPGLPQSRDKISEDLVIYFEKGFRTAFSQDTECVDFLDNAVTELFQQSKCTWPLTRHLNFDSINDYDLFGMVWVHIYGAEDNMRTYLSNKRSILYKTQRYKEMQQEDEPLEKTKKAEDDYFRKDILGKSIARNLTVVSQWQFQNYCLRREEMFVTDSKVWKWVLEVIQEMENIYGEVSYVLPSTTARR